MLFNENREFRWMNYFGEGRKWDEFEIVEFELFVVY